MSKVIGMFLIMMIAGAMGREVITLDESNVITLRGAVDTASCDKIVRELMSQTSDDCQFFCFSHGGSPVLDLAWD